MERIEAEDGGRDQEPRDAANQTLESSGKLWKRPKDPSCSLQRGCLLSLDSCPGKQNWGLWLPGDSARQNMGGGEAIDMSRPGWQGPPCTPQV